MAEKTKLVTDHFGEWGYFYRCADCKKRLTSDEVYFNGGICPHCGIASEVRVDHEKIPTRFVRTVPWWKFWGKRGYWQTMEDFEKKKKEEECSEKN